MSGRLWRTQEHLPLFNFMELCATAVHSHKVLGTLLGGGGAKLSSIELLGGVLNPPSPSNYMLGLRACVALWSRVHALFSCLFVLFLLYSLVDCFLCSWQFVVGPYTAVCSDAPFRFPSLPFPAPWLHAVHARCLDLHPPHKAVSACELTAGVAVYPVC